MEREELERWREAGKEVGRKLGVVQERERIIKLLENQQMRFISNGFWTEGVAVGASVALIKGKNK